MRETGLIWLSRDLHQQCVAEAAHCFPLETGGALMGYWNDQTAVVTCLVEPGPYAVRETHNFEPDQEWQLKEIARRHMASKGRETYLGDWHSHPNASSGRLSGTDRIVLRAIMNEPKARTSRPLMMILFGANQDWRAEAWVCCRRARWPAWRGPRISAMGLKLWDRG